MKWKLHMNATLADALLLCYRTPAASVWPLLPDGLEPVTRGPWAFWNVLACRATHIRPAGVPQLCGTSLTQVSYRLLVQAMNARGELRRGLYFLRSDVDSAIVAATSDRLTDLRPHKAAVAWDADNAGVRVTVTQTDRGAADATIRVTNEPGVRQPDSCFPTLRDAEEFLAYSPLGLATEVNGAGRWLRLTRVKCDHRARRERTLTVAEAQLALFDELGQRDAALELATRVEPVAYAWEIGEREPLIDGRLQHTGIPRRRVAGSRPEAADAPEPAPAVR